MIKKYPMFWVAILATVISSSISIVNVYVNYTGQIFLGQLTIASCLAALLFQLFYALNLNEWHDKHNHLINDRLRAINIQFEHILSSVNKNAPASDIFVEYFNTRADLYAAMEKVFLNCVSKETFSPWECSVTSFFPMSLEDKREPVQVRRYHETLTRFITQPDGPYIRRIISVPTANKFHYVKEQMRKYKNCGNFSLRWHERSSYSNDNIMIPLNIQIYGNKDLFITSPRTNNTNFFKDQTNAKHVHFISESLVKLFLEYYNQLWDGCVDDSLLEHGHLQKNGPQKMEAHYKKHLSK